MSDRLEGNVKKLLSLLQLEISKKIKVSNDAWLDITN